MRSRRACLGVHIGHDRGAAIVVDGKIAACVAEERLDRRKHSPSPELPFRSIRAVLAACDLTANDLAGVAISYTNVVIGGIVDQLAAELRDGLAHPDLIVLGASHHWCHALSAYHTSGAECASIVVADGAGDIVGSRLEAESVFLARGAEIVQHSQRLQDFGLTRTDRRNIFNLAYMHDLDKAKQISLGRKYEQLTYLIGFGHDQSGKTMGLAAYGKPMFSVQPEIDDRLNFSLTMADLLVAVDEEFHRSKMPWHRFLVERRADIAATTQTALEDFIIAFLRAVYEQQPNETLCVAGGVFLNCKMNHEILRKTPFKRLHVFPAAGDDGQAVGAAFHAYRELCGSPEVGGIRDVFFGPTNPPEDVEKAVAQFQLYAKKYDEPWLIERIVDDLAAGRIVAIVRGRSEIGPRALCHRSILADPRKPGMRDQLNRIKGRELFRPFAPVTTSEAQFKYFELEQESPFMLFATRLKQAYKDKFPAIVHVDGTSRVQAIEKDIDPFMHALLVAFGTKTGHPVLLNTSFNLAGDPIVETAHDAVSTYLASNLDCLVLEDVYVADKTRRVPR